MVIYETKNLKIEVKESGILTVEENGRVLNVDLKPLAKQSQNINS